jgi:hypothetical protein
MATLTSGVTWDGPSCAISGGSMSCSDPSRRGAGSALHFGGSGGDAATAGQVIGPDPFTGAPAAVRTDRSFTVTAWVKLGDTATYRTAVSVDGKLWSGFGLEYAVNVNRWAFQMATSDTAPFNADWAVANSITPQVGVWTHLAGVYDAGTGQMQLYVNGVLAGTASHASTWNATGVLRIGQGENNGGPGNPWSGDISDVRLYPRVLSPAEIAAIVNTPVLAGDWELAEGTGTIAHDTSGAKLPFDGVLSGGTSWVPVNPTDARPADGGLPPGASALSFDDSQSPNVTAPYPFTSQPPLDTMHSFTVAAWVRLLPTPFWSTVISIDGSRMGGFYLLYSPQSQKWNFVMHTTDTDNAQGDWAQGTSPVDFGKWTHLAAVYDAVTQQIRLYVNGVLEASASHVGTWSATGKLHIGAAIVNGALTNFWHGDLASVQVYSGVLSDQQIATLAGV